MEGQSFFDEPYSLWSNTYKIGEYEIVIEENWMSDGCLGSVQWAGGKALADCIVGNPSLVRGKDVLELGAGLGIVSIVASKVGAKSVVASDVEDGIEDLTESILLNQLDSDITAEVLYWGKDDDRRFDVIVAGDCCYRLELVDPLLVSMRGLLKCRGEVLMNGVLGDAVIQEFSQTVLNHFSRVEAIMKDGSRVSLDLEDSQLNWPRHNIALIP